MQANYPHVVVFAVHCRECDQRYEQKANYEPSMCGACGSRRVNVELAFTKVQMAADLQDIYHYFGTVLEAMRVGCDWPTDCTFDCRSLREALDLHDHGLKKLQAFWDRWAYAEPLVNQWDERMHNICTMVDTVDTRIMSQKDLTDACLVGIAAAVAIADIVGVDPNRGVANLDHWPPGKSRRAS